jgi:hypothetical protein
MAEESTSAVLRIPRAAEGLERLEESGDTDTAFGWEHLPHSRLWRDQRRA